MPERIVREAVGVFQDARLLQATVDDLLVAGFDRSHMSLMATCRTVERRLGHLYEKVSDIEDDPRIPRIAFVGCDSRTEAKGAAAAGLAYIGAVAAAGAVVASGGTLAITIAAAAACGGVGGALGAMLARSLTAREARNLQDRLEHGGILLWVATGTPEREAKACEILARHGAADVHVHGLPHPEAARDGGVSRELTWIGKPILGSLLGIAPPMSTAPAETVPRRAT
jgi:hypothetical protein